MYSHQFKAASVCWYPNRRTPSQRGCPEQFKHCALPSARGATDEGEPPSSASWIASVQYVKE